MWKIPACNCSSDISSRILCPAVHWHSAMQKWASPTPFFLTPLPPAVLPSPLHRHLGASAKAPQPTGTLPFPHYLQPVQQQAHRFFLQNLIQPLLCPHLVSRFSRWPPNWPCPVAAILSCYSNESRLKNGTPDHVASPLKVFSGFSLHLE